MFAENPTGRRTTVLRILLLLIAAVALIVLGRVTAPDDRTIRSVAGVPVGFARSEHGARAAGMTYAAARARATLLNPERRRTLLEAIATARFAAVADRDDEQRDLAPLADQEEGRYLVTALGSRLDTHDENRARLTVWLIQLWAADAAVASFSTQTVALVWEDDDWRLDGQTESDVQAVPQITQTPRQADTRRLVTTLAPPTFGRP